MEMGGTGTLSPTRRGRLAPTDRPNDRSIWPHLSEEFAQAVRAGDGRRLQLRLKQGKKLREECAAKGEEVMEGSLVWRNWQKRPANNDTMLYLYHTVPHRTVSYRTGRIKSRGGGGGENLPVEEGGVAEVRLEARKEREGEFELRKRRG